MKKIILLLSIFCFTQTYALTSSLEIDKNKAQVDERVWLKLTINSWENEQINVKEIKWIENFDILGQSQSSSFSNINWKTNSVIELEFSLSPKKKWNYEIWPIVLNDGKTDILTNSVKVEISWEKMFLNNTNTNNINIKNNPKTNLWNLSPPEEEIKKFEEKSDYKIFLLILIISLLIIIVYFSLKKLNTSPLASQIQPSPLPPLPRGRGENNDYDIIFPNINDDDFIWKIDELIKQKITNKYYIDTKTKSYSQILELIENKNDKQKFKEIFDIIIQAKYSNTITNNEKLLEIIKEV